MGTTAAETARDAAIDRVEVANEAWVDLAAVAVERVATLRAEFTTDAVWAMCERLFAVWPEEPRAMGATMRRAVALGFCEATNETRKSVRVECHARPVRIWRSLIYDTHKSRT